MRWVIVILFAALVGVSIGFTTQLKSTTDVPLIFPPQNNIQKYLQWHVDGFLYKTDNCGNIGFARDVRNIFVEFF